VTDPRSGAGRPGGWALLARNRMAAGGLVVVGVVAAVALAAPLLPLPDPDATRLGERLMPLFSPGHPLGTDPLGRDLLSRIVWGTRVSLAVGAVASLFAAVAGSAVGVVAGYQRRWLDSLLMRGIDVLMAFPYLLLALAIVAALGPGLVNAMLAISVVNIPFFARTVRGATLGIAGRPFVDAARLAGMGHARILWGEVLPNVLPVIVITLTTTLGWMILETAGLSFLGLGAQPPQADLGSMLGEGRGLIVTAPHVATVPGLVILLLVIGINLLGDGIRDVLDPRLRAGVPERPGMATAVGPKVGAEPTAESGGAVLAVTGLSTRFRLGGRTARAVEDVSFTVGRGECLGIVGESGCGKSVTALSLLRLVPTPPGEVDAGRVAFGGRNLLAVAPAELTRLRGGRIAYVFQDPDTSLHPMIPVGWQIAEAVRVHQGVGWRAATARAVALLGQVGIPDPASRARAHPHELSGGMRQRVAIAMALANDPELLVADEPTTALDVTVQAQVLGLLDRLRRERGMAVMLITHDFGVVREVCERVVVMYAGRVVETGPVRDVVGMPRHPYTRRLIACAPRVGEVDRPLTEIPGLPPAPDTLPPGCAFADRCELAVAACRAPVPLETPTAARTVRCIRWREVGP
jgi:peptide/nickel transport system permease protein